MLQNEQLELFNFETKKRGGVHVLLLMLSRKREQVAYYLPYKYIYVIALEQRTRCWKRRWEKNCNNGMISSCCSFRERCLPFCVDARAENEYN